MSGAGARLEDGDSVHGVRHSNNQLSIDDFVVLSKLGEGGFGTVLLVRKTSNGKLYALKMLVKKNMTHSGDAKRAISESIAMQEIRHPFIVQLHFAFQDAKHVYFVLTFVGGGDLFSHLERGTFSESWCKIYIAEIALAVAHVHSQDFVYRDLKPENVLVGSDGHLVLADFGLAKKLTDGRLKTVIGTPSLMAPELFLNDGSGYGTSVDWWALGLLLCEMLLGETLIADDGGSLGAMLARFKNGTHLKPMPTWVSREAASLIEALLTVEPQQRLCCGPEGIAELKRHPFFAGLDWDQLFLKNIEAPLSPFGAPPQPLAATAAISDPDARRAAGRALAASANEEQLEELASDFAAFSGADAALEPSLAGGASTQLCEAAASGDIERLRELLRRGVPVDASDYDRRTALHLAASEGLQAAVELLLSAGALPSPVDRWGGTPLDDALRSGHDELASHLRARGAVRGSPAQPPAAAAAAAAAASSQRPDAASASGQQTGAAPAMAAKSRAQAELCEAAASGDLARVVILVAGTGINVDSGDYDRRTALHLAASEGHEGVVRFLAVEAKAALSPLDRWGGTPLDDAFRQGHESCQLLLRSLGAHRGTATAMPTIGDLCEAAASSDLERLAMLLQQGAVPVDRGDYDRRTALHVAASEGLLPVVRFLVETASAHHSPIDRWGASPLDDAIRWGHDHVAAYLQGRNAQTSGQLMRIGSKPGGVSASSSAAAPQSKARAERGMDLCGAAADRNLVALRVLIAQGAGVNSCDYDMRTALHIGASEGHLDVVELLLEEGRALLSPIDRYGYTPLDDALRHAHPEVCQYLRSKGAQQGEGHVEKSSADLCDAAARGDLHTLRALVLQGVDANKSDYDRRTALHLAASNGLLPVVKFLLSDAGVDPSPLDRWGGSPLDDALRSKHKEVGEFLAAAGARKRETAFDRVRNLPRMSRASVVGRPRHSSKDKDKDKSSSSSGSSGSSGAAAMNLLGMFSSARPRLASSSSKEGADDAETREDAAEPTGGSEAGGSAHASAAAAAAAALSSAAPTRISTLQRDMDASPPPASASAEGRTLRRVRSRPLVRAKLLRVALPLVPLPEDRGLCPLTKQRFADPVVASDGYSYEREAMNGWFEREGLVSPVTGVALETMHLIPNRTLLALLAAEFRKEEAAELDRAGTAAAAARAAALQPPPLAKVHSHPSASAASLRPTMAATPARPASDTSGEAVAAPDAKQGSFVMRSLRRISVGSGPPKEKEGTTPSSSQRGPEPSGGSGGQGSSMPSEGNSRGKLPPLAVTGSPPLGNAQPALGVLGRSSDTGAQLALGGGSRSVYQGLDALEFGPGRLASPSLRVATPPAQKGRI